MENSLVISRSSLQKNQLEKNVALITGAAGGIGFETCRSLSWLGVKVVIADTDKEKGKQAELIINREFGVNSCLYIHTDVSNQRDVQELARRIYRTFGKLDILVNNATIAPIGAVHQVGIKMWDMSYGVNLRGPVLLLESFLPHMLARGSGILVFVPSSGAAPFMGAYEVFKTSQIELSNTLAGELEGTSLITYSIGPGIVKTDTALKAIAEIAPLYGKSESEFIKMNEAVILTAEEAGAGFAASIALAPKYNGLEISSIQALTDVGIKISNRVDDRIITLSEHSRNEILKKIVEIKETFEEQVAGWKTRPVFEKQWIFRDFKKTTGAAPEHFIQRLRELEMKIDNMTLNSSDVEVSGIIKLKSYYEHQINLLKGYEKNPEKQKEHEGILTSWINKIDEFMLLEEGLFSTTMGGGNIEVY